MKLRNCRSRTRLRKTLTPDVVMKMFQEFYHAAESAGSKAADLEQKSPLEVRAVIEQTLVSSTTTLAKALDEAEARDVCKILMLEEVIEKVPLIQQNIKLGKSGVRGRMVN